MYPWLKTARPEVKKIGHMNPSDEAGFTESDDRTMIAEKNGYTNVVKEFFKRGSTDFYPVATRLVAASPDLIDFGGTIGRDQSLGCKALRELGYKGEIMLGYSDAKSFVEVAGADAAERHLLFDTLVEPQNAQQKELEELVAEELRSAIPLLRVHGVGHAVRAGEGDPHGAVGRSGRDRQGDGGHGMGRPLRAKGRFGMKSVYGIDTTITRPIAMAS